MYRYVTGAGKSRLSLRAILTICLALLTLLAGCDQQANRPTVRIGYMNCNSEEETMARFLPLTRYLSDKAGVNFEAVPVDTHDFEKRYKAGEFTFTHSNSLLYIILQHNHQLDLLVTEKRGRLGSRTAGSIIALKSSGMTKLSDIKGKSMVFGPMLAPTGYLAEYDLMLRSGIDPEDDLSFYTIPQGSFKHEKVIYGVMYGKYDVAAAPVLDLEIMTREGKINPDDFVVLGQSPIIPYCTFGAVKGADPKLVEKVRKALLELTPEATAEVNGERVKVLKSAWIDGFEQLPDKEYDLIRDMARRVNMPPYQKL